MQRNESFQSLATKIGPAKIQVYKKLSTKLAANWFKIHPRPKKREQKTQTAKKILWKRVLKYLKKDQMRKILRKIKKKNVKVMKKKTWMRNKMSLFSLLKIFVVSAVESFNILIIFVVSAEKDVMYFWRFE